MSCRPHPGHQAWRTLLMATLSWLGLAQAAEAQAHNPTRALDRAAIEEVLQRLDAAFVKAEVEDYLGTFEPDHPGAHALLGQQLQSGFACGKPLHRQSTIIGEPRQVGPRTVVRVRSEVKLDDREIAVQLEDTIFAFRNDGGRAVPTFAIESPRSTKCPATDVFRCPPCNYEIGGVAGWICVPMSRDHAQALEASSFYLAGTDLACDVTVRVAPAALGEPAPKPTTIAEDLAAAMRQFEPEARPGLAVHWLPPSHADGHNEVLEGARIEIQLPPTASAPEGNLARFHIVQFGTLQHLLLVRGSKAAMREHRAQLDQLLASFHLLDLDLDRAEAASRSLRHHIGGELDGSSYHNSRYAVAFTGPEGWQPQQLCAGATLRVRWHSPSGSYLWLSAYAVPPGMAFWCQETSERWLRQLCKHTNIKLPAQLRAWDAATDCDALTRTITGKIEGALPGTSGERLLHIAFRKDLLIIADGSGATADDRKAIQNAFLTLRL